MLNLLLVLLLIETWGELEPARKNLEDIVLPLVDACQTSTEALGMGFPVAADVTVP